MTHDRPEAVGLTRTVCDCAADVASCRRPGVLLMEDVDRIVDYLRAQGRDSDLRRLLRHSRRSVAAIIAPNGTVHRQIFPTITPKVRRGACVFLDEHQRCTIHPVAPFGCAFFDVHEDAAPAQERVHWGYHRIAGDPRYRALLDTLDTE